MAHAGAAVHLLKLLCSAAKRREPRGSRRRIARLVLTTFHRILDALDAYRQNLSANPVFSDGIRKELLRRLKRINKRRLKDRPRELQDCILEPHLGQDLLFVLMESADLISAEHETISSGTATSFVYELGTLYLAGKPLRGFLVETDTALLSKLIKTTIERLEPGDDEQRLKARLRALIRKPSLKKWRCLASSMLDGGEEARQLWFFRAWHAGRVIGIFRGTLPGNWIDEVGVNEQRITSFSKALLEHLQSQAEKEPGRPSNLALQTYANQVDAAYFELAGKHLTITRPTEKSALSNRQRTTGLGLDLMTAALQMLSPSLSSAQARTAVERLPKH